MGVLTRAIGIRNYSLEDPAQPLLPMSALMESLGIGKSDAGINVNEKQAMRLTTAYACIQNIAADLSGLPLPVLQRMPDGSIREATEHRMYPLIQTSPNRNMTSMVYRGAMLSSVLGWGNSYSYIRRDNAARVVELLPLPSECTSPVLLRQQTATGKDGLTQRKLMYATTATPDQLPSYIDPENILHISGLSYDGYVGMSPIQTCKNAFGIGLAAERFGAQLFANGAKASGVLSHPGTLGTEAFENLKKSIREIISGENALRPLVLEEGMKWEQTTINPNDAQFLETRNFQREEVAALYRMPMHLLQSLQRATNNNIEHQSLDYIRTCLRMWAVRIEQEINRKLLSGDYFVEHDFNAFQRGDYQSQVNGIVALRNAGVFHANDAMRQLRLNPIPVDEGGDVRLVPLNMVPLTQVAQESNAGAESNGAGESDAGEEVITDSRGARVIKAYRRLFRDALGRIANRTKFDDAFAYKALQPIVASMAEATMSMYFTADQETKDRAETESNRIARELVESLKAKYEGNHLSTIAVAITDEAYAALYKALIG
jgi:HK97 family phage portal protein